MIHKMAIKICCLLMLIFFSSTCMINSDFSYKDLLHRREQVHPGTCRHRIKKSKLGISYRAHWCHARQHMTVLVQCVHLNGKGLNIFKAKGMKMDCFASPHT